SGTVSKSLHQSDAGDLAVHPRGPSSVASGAMTLSRSDAFTPASARSPSGEAAPPESSETLGIRHDRGLVTTARAAAPSLARDRRGAAMGEVYLTQPDRALPGTSSGPRAYAPHRCRAAGMRDA